MRFWRPAVPGRRRPRWRDRRRRRRRRPLPGWSCPSAIAGCQQGIMRHPFDRQDINKHLVLFVGQLGNAGADGAVVARITCDCAHRRCWPLPIVLCRQHKLRHRGLLCLHTAAASLGWPPPTPPPRSRSWELSPPRRRAPWPPPHRAQPKPLPGRHRRRHRVAPSSSSRRRALREAP